MDFSVYITSRMLSVVPALWFAGWLITQTNKVPHWLTPFILTALGIIAAFVIEGASANSVLQGILCAAAAVFGHQAIKQGAEGMDEMKHNHTP